MKFKYDICIVGGAGHIGLPLGLAFAKKKFRILLLDTNSKNLKLVEKKKMPFGEKKGLSYLKNFYKYLDFSFNEEDISLAKNVIICIGTPISKKKLPEINNFLNFFVKNNKIFSNNQNIIIRSSVYPGVCKKIRNILGKRISLSYCPERIMQGYALIELPKLTQIISGFDINAVKNSIRLFKKICKDTVTVSIDEAELIKLFSNAYRYVNFSIANQFYLMCESLGLKYKRIHSLMKRGYYRNVNIPMSGFTAGPCLSKDTIQLSHFFKHKFNLGLSAVKINENFPIEIFKNIKKKFNLKKNIIGLLGMTFKPDIDDLRDSLAVNFYLYLKQRKVKFYVTDIFFKNYDNFLDIKDFIQKCDIIILTSPHKQYKKINFPKNTKVIDPWNFYKHKE